MKQFNDYDEESFLLIKDLIQDNGYKMTSQREDILIEFINNKEKHLSAEEIYNMMKHKGIGISTVYRNLNLFVDLKILKELKFDDTSYYELKMYARKPLHIHFKCEECGDIKDIVDKEIILKCLKVDNLVEEKYIVEINDVDIMFHGLCNNCVQRK